MKSFKDALKDAAKVGCFMLLMMGLCFWLGMTILAPFFLPLHIWWVSVLYVLNIFAVITAASMSDYLIKRFNP